MKVIKNDQSNYKNLITVICIIILDILITCFYVLYKGGSEPGKLIIIFAFIFYWGLIKATLIIIKIHKQRIKEEIKRGIAPDKNKITKGKIFDKLVIPEYDLPNQIQPVEAGFLYDMSIGKEDIVCLLYKRMGIGIITISYTEGGIIVIKNGDIQEFNLPYYEYKFWDLLFTDGNTIQIPNESIYNNLDVFLKGVEQYCIEKGWITYKKIYSIFTNNGKLFEKTQFIPFGRLLGILLSIAIIILCVFVASKFRYLSTDNTRVMICGICIGLAIPITEVFIFYFIISMKETSRKHTIKLTQQGKELVRKIHGYKKFLEACEKKQLKEFMKQDPLYMDKMLPYAVALGLENIISDKIPQKIIDDKSRNIFLLEKVI